MTSSQRAENPSPVAGLPPTEQMFVEQTSHHCSYSYPFSGRYHGIRRPAGHAWRNMTSWRMWGRGKKTTQPRDSWLPHFLSDMTFPRKWTPPSDPAGRTRGWLSWSSDTTEREEGVTAIEVTQWLELQDTSVTQEGRGSSNPWNPPLLKVPRKTAPQL